MPSCPECGIDVEVAGLCPECRAHQEKEARSEGNASPEAGWRRSRWPLVLLISAVSLIVFGAAFFLGRVSAAQGSAPEGSPAPVLAATPPPLETAEAAEVPELQ